jgi:hypothetical protein
MHSSTNHRSILEAAKKLIQGNTSFSSVKKGSSFEINENPKEDSLSQQNPTSLDTHVTYFLKLINKTIIEAKESLYCDHSNKPSKSIEDLKKNCLDKEIFNQEELLPIKATKDLLFLLQKLRKKLKNVLHPNEQEESPVSELSQELLRNTNQYTIQKLCEEFSCSPEKISREFVESKRNLCCSKIQYLLSQYHYCETLYQNLEEINVRNHFTLAKSDLPNVKKGIKLNFDQVSELAEEAIDHDVPDMNQNTIILGTLSYFNDRLVKDIDIYCHKVDLTNTYLSSIEKSQDLILSIHQ